MSMEISNAYGNYGTAANNKTTQKESATNETKQYSNAAEYSEALAKKYDCVRNGNVAISASYLRQCASDPKKAEELEENLSLFKDIYEHGYESAKKNAASFGGKVTHYSMTWNVDSKGDISMMSVTTVVVDNGTKSQKELREELAAKRKEKKEAEEKLEIKAAKKQEQEEQLEKLREKNSEEDEKVQTYEIRFVGKDAVQMSEKMNEALSQAIAAKTAKLTAGFDIKV